MCVDFTDLNKACPKDSYPLPNIDKLVEATLSYQYLSFMDAYSRYNQIWMHPDDEEKMTFIIDGPNYYYRVIPFGLKNVEATYQKLIDKVFEEHIDKNVEVYEDDMVAKILRQGDHCADLEEIFIQLKKKNCV